MRFSHISLIAVILVVIAVALAGCSGNDGAKPLTSATKATGTTSSGSSSSGSSSSGSSSSGSSSSGTSGASLFGNLNYNWVEYKMTTDAGGQGMTIYYKFDKTNGKCSMRFEGAAAASMPANMQNIDCGGKGGQSVTDPNKVSSDAKVDCALVPETVTVPAGTFNAKKCTVTSKGVTQTVWADNSKGMVKVEGTTEAGAFSMVLNAYG